MDARKAPASKSKAGQARPARPAAKAPPPRPTRANSGPYKANVGARIVADFIDFFIACLPALVLALQGHWTWGAPVAALYLLIKDGMPLPPLDFKSIGKKIVGLHVEVESTGVSHLDPQASILRNVLPVAGLLVFPLIYMASAPAAFVVAILAPVVELAILLRDPNGRRIGDRMAGTKVLD